MVTGLHLRLRTIGQRHRKEHEHVAGKNCRNDTPKKSSQESCIQEMFLADPALPEHLRSKELASRHAKKESGSYRSRERQANSSALAYRCDNPTSKSDLRG